MRTRWDDHIDRVNGLIASRRHAPYAPPVAPVKPSPGNWADIAGLLPEAWRSDAGGGFGDPGHVGPPGDLGGMLGGINSSSFGGLLGALGGGLVGGPVGGLLGGLAGRGIGSALGGTLGGDGMAGGAELAGLEAQAEQNAAAMGAMGGEYGDARGMQSGGYTGAGADGIVQPNRRAKKFVHEGEIVLPWPVVRGLLGR